MSERNSYMVADAHCDFLAVAYASQADIARPIEGQNLSIDRLKRGNVRLQYFACWVDMKLRTSALQQTLSMIDIFYNMLKEHGDELVNATERTQDDRIRCLLSIEGGEAIMGLGDNLRIFHRLGVRSMTLTWNNTNELASPAMRRANVGLTDLGKRIIREMARLNMAVDVAHLSDAGIDDVLRDTDGPIMASHSNARALFEHKRSISDRHIREIARRGGVIGVNFYSKQLTDKKGCSIADIVPHIRHMADVGGIDCVCLGSDFDGMPEYPADLRNSADFPNLAQALLDDGFSEGDVAAIMYGNLARFSGSII